MAVRFGTIRPRPLPAGAACFLFAPAGAVRDPFRSDGIAFVRELGYEPILGASLDQAPAPFAAGSPQLRLDDWHRALEARVPALLPARGGYGSIHLATTAPLARTAQIAPLWVGASDLTVLQTALLQQHGMVTFYGPMPCGQLTNAGDNAGRAGFAAALNGTMPTTLRFPHAHWLNARAASGELRGGCLSVLATLCGTPWQLDARDALVLLEDIGEHPFRIERMLRQMQHAGALRGAAGLLFGRFPDCVDRSGDPDLVRRVLTGFSQECGLPAVFGLDIGHGLGAVPLPLGIPASMSDDTLALLESPYAPNS